MRIPILLALATTPAFAVAQDRPVLTVMTYDSFAAEWGPGPVVEPLFESECGCDLVWQTAGDGAALLARLRLEGARAEADVVLGLDTALVADAAATGLFAPHGLNVVHDLPVAWDDPLFVPFDWGSFAFVYRTQDVPEPPASFAELAASDLRIVIQDPRSSTPGLGLLLWVKAAHGETASSLWEGLADNIVTVTAGWTEAYNLFLQGEADMVLSYTTSPAYHLIAEGNASYAAAAFDEGNYLQVEVAAKVASGDQALADRFLAFLLSPAFQSAIPTGNWMYPAVTPPGGLPEGFSGLTVPERSLLLDPAEAQRIRDTALAEWQAALSR